MASSSSSRAIEHESLPLDVTGRDEVTRRWSMVASPTTCFSACRTGLISDLLLRCGHGDEAAFEAVMDIFYSVVLAAAARELPEEEVEDAVYETFVAIWHNTPDYRPGGETAVEWVMGHLAQKRPADGQEWASQGHGARHCSRLEGSRLG